MAEARRRVRLARRQVRALVADTARAVRMLLRGHDLWILTAGVTFYALLAAIPSLIVAVRITAAVAGRGRVDSLAAAMGRALPDTQSPAPLIQSFVEHASRVRWRDVAVAVIPATVWGEGLRRGFGRITPAADGSTKSSGLGRVDGWRSRIAVLPVLLLSPAGLLAVLGVAPTLARLLSGTESGDIGTADVGQSVLAFYLALNVDWIVLSVALAYVYRALGPRRPGRRALLTGAFFTGAFISGFAQGFVVFLWIPVDLGSPFGGFGAVGAVVAVALWMWLFTALSVLGYAITLALDERWTATATAPSTAGPAGRPDAGDGQELELRG